MTVGGGGLPSLADGNTATAPGDWAPAVAAPGHDQWTFVKSVLLKTISPTFMRMSDGHNGPPRGQVGPGARLEPVVDDPTDLGATIVVVQALCLPILYAENLPFLAS